MYSLSCRSWMFVRRYPMSQVTLISKFSQSSVMMIQNRVSDEFNEKKMIHNELLKRSYVSVGGKKNKNFDLSKLGIASIVDQSKQLVKNVQLVELKNAPQPAFWYGAAGLVPFILPELIYLISGYSPFLAGVQMAFGATVCSFLGGVKWGHSLDKELNWENLGLAVGPQAVAWLSLLVPQTLGLVMLSGGLLASAFIDLTTVKYPEWYRAMRLSFTIPSVICLLLTALFCLFH